MAITGVTLLGLNARAITVDHDPEDVSTEGPQGSLIISTSTGQIYRKLSSGDNTDVLIMTIGSQTFDWDAELDTTAQIIVGGLLSFELLSVEDTKVVGGDILPEGTDLTQPVFLDNRLVVLSTGTEDETVRIRLTARYVGDGEPADKTPDEILETNVLITNTDKLVHKINFTLDNTLIEDGDLLNLEFSRVGTDTVNDLFTGSVGVAERSSLRFSR